MPYKPHPELVEVPDERVLWRYLDFPRFVSMIRDASLFFARLSHLTDKHEGTFPSHQFDLLVDRLSKEVNSTAPLFSDVLWRREAQKKLRGLFSLRDEYAVNCWHCGRTESEAFWRIYSDVRKGVAIKSSGLRLKSVFQNCGNRDVLLSKVNYIDFDSETLPMHKDLPESQLHPVFHKRRCFEYEKEVRAAFRLRRQSIPFTEIEGTSIQVDLEQMIEEVVVSPDSDLWFYRLVKDVLKERLPDVNCRRSSLYDGPAHY